MKITNGFGFYLNMIKMLE